MINFRSVNDRVQNNRKIIYSSLIVFLFVFSLYCVQYHGVDFYTYFSAVIAFHHNERGYISQEYLYYYPPLTAQLISPLVIFPKKIAYFIWIFLSSASVFLSVYLLTEDRKKFLLYCLIAFAFTPVETTLYAGQVNALLLLSLSLAYYGIRKNYHYWSSFGIAMGIMLKIIPLAHFFYFAWKGKVKILFAVIGFLLLLFFVSLPFVGLQGWVDFFNVAISSGNVTTPSQGFHGSDNLNFNQSLSGLMARFIHNDQLAVKAWHLCSAVVIMATGLICWPTQEFRKNFELEFCLVTIAINLVMPYTWYYQLMILLLPLLIIFQQMEEDWYFKNLLPFFLIGFILTDLHGAFWHHFNHPLLSSFPTFFAIFLWGCLAYKIIQNKIGVTEVRPVKCALPHR